MPYDPDYDFEMGKMDYFGDPGGQYGTSFPAHKTSVPNPGHETKNGHGPDAPHTPEAVVEEFDEMQRTSVLANSTKHNKHTVHSLTRAPASLNGTPRNSRVEVTITSNLKRSAYLHVADDSLSDDLVTSDIGPKHKKAMHSTSAINPLQVPSHTSQHASLTSSQNNENRSFSTTPVSLPSSTAGVKKRGRPKGWKVGMGPYKNMTPDRSPPLSGAPAKPKRPGGEGKRRGRPAKPPSPGPIRLYQSLTDVHFTPFLCEWEGCPAQLHNFETLRRHVLVVHGRFKTCKWGQCLERQREHERPLELDSDAAFQQHVDRAHLTPFVWHVGDGPSNQNPIPRTVAPTRGDAVPPPRYLFDERGVQVTPSVREQQLENDEDRRLRLRRLRTLCMRRNKNAPDEPEYTKDELAELEAMRAARVSV